MSDDSRSYYPVFLDVTGRNCIVVGGGLVALRKAKTLLEHGARVSIVAPSICTGLEELASHGELDTISRDYRKGDLGGAVLVIAATGDRAVNAIVAGDARESGILVNAVDDPENCDFIVPSCVRRGDLTVAISTGGRSPALARKIRTQLEDELATRYAPLASLAGEVREEVRRQGLDVGAEDWQRALNVDRLAGILQTSGPEEAKAALLDSLLESRNRSAPNGPHLCVVGVNHSTMPVEFREKLAAGTADVGAVPLQIGDRLAYGVVLSTCNRTEIYAADFDGDSAQEESIAFLRRRADMPEEDLLSRVYVHRDAQAVEHLFRVSSGLDSMILGEHEILGQVRQALSLAENGGVIGLPLLTLFRQAVQVGRIVRDRTGISRNALSVSSAAVDLAVKAVGNLAECRVLVVGAGEAGQLVARAARDRGARRMAVTSRSHEKASQLATALGGEAVPLMNLNEELRAADIVVSCTGAPHVILDSSLVSTTMEGRSDRPLVIIDIAVPRDVEPEVRRLANVFLYNIDDLNEISHANRRLRQKETKQAMAIVVSEAQRFDSWWQTLGVRDTIAALARKAEDIRQAQLTMTLKRLPSLSPEERDSLEAMTRAITQKLLHEPIEHLKEDQSYAEVVNELFRLDAESP